MSLPPNSIGQRKSWRIQGVGKWIPPVVGRAWKSHCKEGCIQFCKQSNPPHPWGQKVDVTQHNSRLRTGAQSPAGGVGGNGLQSSARKLQTLHTPSIPSPPRPEMSFQIGHLCTLRGSPGRQDKALHPACHQHHGPALASLSHLLPASSHSQPPAVLDPLQCFGVAL